MYIFHNTGSVSVVLERIRCQSTPGDVARKNFNNIFFFDNTFTIPIFPGPEDTASGSVVPSTIDYEEEYYKYKPPGKKKHLKRPFTSKCLFYIFYDSTV